ncbi:hypothetical protein PR048_012665 [Dryococelus australis]|uniref:Uncharacterized protein n=1 Tax=Dryococelus australis TaxID=614101 RepID=A0ABQ9HQ02_9NEOP|nr:hypothetical protein PR048_012665 [Dryococelus australis]
MENTAVTIQAQEIAPYIQKFIRETEKDKHSVTACSSFDVVLKAVKDKFLVAELSFFTVVTNLVEPFLCEFQTEKPMVPFLYDELTSVAKTLMERVVKPEVFEGVSSLKKIDVS